VVNLQCNALNVRTISSYQLSTNYGVGLAVGSMGNNKTRPKVLTWEFGLDWTVVRWSVKWAKIHKNRFERSQKASPAGIGGKRIAIAGFPPPPLRRAGPRAPAGSVKYSRLAFSKTQGRRQIIELILYELFRVLKLKVFVNKGYTSTQFRKNFSKGGRGSKMKIREPFQKFLH
jgi:hypothetical protein